MGKALAERGISPDAIISSTALRAFTTAKLMAKELGFPETEIRRESALYLPRPDQVLRVIQQIDEAHDCAILFGHNPGFHETAWELTHPGMVLGAYAESEFEQVLAGLDGKKHPADWAEAERNPVHTVVASSADRLIELIENDGIIARSKLGISGSPTLGSHVFVLNGAHNETRGMHWSAISHHHEAGAGPGSSDIMRRLQADNSFVQAMTRRLHPGMIFITTDAPLTPDRRSGRDFVIATS